MRVNLILCIMVLTISNIDSKMYVQEWFNKADLNGDKILSFEEAKHFLPKLQVALVVVEGASKVVDKADEILKAWNEFDLDGNGSIDLAEFKEAVVKYFNNFSRSKKGAFGKLAKQI